MNDGGAERLESGPDEAGAESHHAFEETESHRETSHEEIGAGINAPIVTPNAPSAPEWSLAAQHTPEHHAAPAEAKGEVHTTVAVEEPRVVKSAPVVAPEPTAANVPEQSTRKGWWQRPFRLRD